VQASSDNSDTIITWPSCVLMSKACQVPENYLAEC
jgi:hypothetical protein